MVKFQVVGAYHLGEFVNRFRHGSLVMKLPDSDAAQIPTVLFGTVNGALGGIASLPQDVFKKLARLQVGPLLLLLLLIKICCRCKAASMATAAWT